MPSATELAIMICYAPQAQEQLKRLALIIPQLQVLNNTCTLKAVEALTEEQKKVWVTFNETLFYQGQAWLEAEGEKVFLYDHLGDLLFTTFPTHPALSPLSTLYHAQGLWHLHHTARNWVLPTRREAQELTRPSALTERLGFFEPSKLPSVHAVEELFQQYSSLKDESPIIEKYQADAFDDFPHKSEGIVLERAQAQWSKSWREIRERRHSSEDPNLALSLQTLGHLLDLAFSADLTQSGRKRRGYPSAGGFYAECVLLEANDIHGLETGVYLYHPHHHALYLVDRHPVSSPRLSLFLVSRLELLRRKYFKISTRLMFQNCGVMLHQLSLACALLELKGYPHGNLKQYPWNKKLNNFWPADWKISGRFIIT